MPFNIERRSCEFASATFKSPRCGPVDKSGDKCFNRGDKRQTAYKPGSVRRRLPAQAAAGRPFLWDAHRCAPHATNPGSRARPPPRHESTFTDSPPAAPIRSCSRWGLPCRPRHRGRGALLPHRFTLARIPRLPKAQRAVCFLWHCPWGRPRRPLTGTVFPWSPDFPPPQPGRLRGASGAAAVRPSGSPRCARAARRRQAPTAASTAPSRASVAASASPVRCSGSQWRWNARSAVGRSGTG